MWTKIILLSVLALVIVLAAANLKRLKRMVDAVKVFYGEVKFEMGKVVWPTQTEVINSTVMVAISVVILTIITGVVDRVFSQLVRMIFT